VLGLNQRKVRTTNDWTSRLGWAPTRGCNPIGSLVDGCNFQPSTDRQGSAMRVNHYVTVLFTVYNLCILLDYVE
jgi:hypothetical protein